MFNNFFPPQNGAVYERMWKNTVQQDRPQTKIRRVRTACLIPKATDTQSEYVIRTVFHCSRGCTNAPQCFITCTLSALFALIFFHGSTAPSGPRPPHYRASISHSDTPHSVGLPWTCDRPLGDSSTQQPTTLFNIHSCLGRDSNSPAQQERLQTHSLDRAATGIGFRSQITQ